MGIGKDKIERILEEYDKCPIMDRIAREVGVARTSVRRCLFKYGRQVPENGIRV